MCFHLEKGLLDWITFQVHFSLVNLFACHEEAIVTFPLWIRTKPKAKHGEVGGEGDDKNDGICELRSGLSSVL